MPDFVPAASPAPRTPARSLADYAVRLHRSLFDLPLGFRAAAAALIACLPPHPDGYVAKAAQATTASFGRHGFSAASVTALAKMIGASLRQPPAAKGLLRQAMVRFSRPFAVVAVTQSPRALLHGRGLPAGPTSDPHPWHGVPVFTAWVTRPVEP